MTRYELVIKLARMRMMRRDVEAEVVDTLHPEPTRQRLAIDDEIRELVLRRAAIAFAGKRYRESRLLKAGVQTEVYRLTREIALRVMEKRGQQTEDKNIFLRTFEEVCA